MEPKDGNAGDGPTPKKKRASSTKRASSARKGAAKTLRSTEQETAATVREEAPQATAKPAHTHPTEPSRSSADTRGAQPRTSGERRVDLEGEHDNSFGDRDADRAADVAADLKSWMDTRREDRDHRGEVL